MSGEFFSRLTTSAASWLAISNGVTNGTIACVAREDARPSRKKPPLAAPPSTMENAGVKAAYINDGALRKPGSSMLTPPRGTGSPLSTAGSAVNARDLTWHVAQDCCPEADRLLSLNSASPATAASDIA